MSDSMFEEFKLLLRQFAWMPVLGFLLICFMCEIEGLTMPGTTLGFMIIFVGFTIADSVKTDSGYKKRY